MYPDGNSLWVGAVILEAIWLLVLSFLIWKNRNFLQSLFPNQRDGLEGRLQEVLKEVGALERFRKQSLNNLQKVALKRYNPYGDTGGDQSFSVVLLDGKDDGVVITSLHSRAGTRIFAKSVRSGGEDKTQFSEEEKETIEMTRARNRKDKF